MYGVRYRHPKSKFERIINIIDKSFARRLFFTRITERNCTIKARDIIELKIPVVAWLKPR
jgi:hypothetical protein